ncbi:hypothetical protein Emag_002411 [Eimeria magna]
MPDTSDADVSAEDAGTQRSSKHHSKHKHSSSSSSSSDKHHKSSGSSHSKSHRESSSGAQKTSSSKEGGSGRDEKRKSSNSHADGGERKHHKSSSSSSSSSSSGKGDKPSSKEGTKESSSSNSSSSSSKHRGEKEGSKQSRKEGPDSKNSSSSSSSSSSKRSHSDKKSEVDGENAVRERSRSREKKRKREKSVSPGPPPVVNTTDPTKNTLGDPFPPDLEGPCYIKLLPQQRDVSILLGVDNRGLINMAKSLNCRSRLSAKDIFFPQTTNRMLLLQGTQDALEKMLKQLLQKIAEPGRHKDSSRSCSMSFIVPQGACDLVPEGCGDQPLRKLRKIEKAKVGLSDRKDMRKQGGRERILTLEGPLPAVQDAACRVLGLLQKISDLRDHMNLRYDSCMPKEQPKEEETLVDPLGEDLDESTMQALASILIPPKEEPVKAGIASVAPNIPNLSDSAKAALISQAQDELARISNMQYTRDTRDVLMQGPAYHKVLVSDLVAAQLLGSNGSIVSQFEAEYNVLVKIAPPEPPPCTERIVIISGQPQDADRALLAVLEKVYAACLMVGHANFMVWRMCAMNTCCALICGPGGQRIRQLGTFTGTRIQISNRDQQTPSHHAAQIVLSNPHERIISILGPLEQVTVALKAMLPYIHADPNQSLSVHQTYGHGYKQKMPAWAETGVLQEGMNMEALNEEPLEDERPVSLPGPFHMKMLIDPALANSLIGKGSQTIIKVSEECDCSIHVLSAKNKFPDCGDRILLMSGTADSVSNAIIALLERCKEVHPNLPYDQMYAKLLVPASVCPSIIGPGGTRVREIREATLTRITVDRNVNPTPERIVSVHGMAQGVHQAVVAISTIAQTDPSLVLMLELQYDYLEQQESQQQNAQLDSNIVGAVLQGVLSVTNKVGGGAADAAVKRLEDMKQAAPQGPLGPMGQVKHGNAPNYEAPVSFVSASASHQQMTAEATRSLALAQRAAQALGDDPRVRVPSPPRQADEWEQQQREIEAYEAQRMQGLQGAGTMAGQAPPPPPPPPPTQETKHLQQGQSNAAQSNMDDDDDPLLEGLMNEAF